MFEQEEAGQAAPIFYALALLAMEFTCFIVVAAGDGNPTVAELPGLPYMIGFADKKLHF